MTLKNIAVFISLLSAGMAAQGMEREEEDTKQEESLISVNSSLGDFNPGSLEKVGKWNRFLLLPGESNCEDAQKELKSIEAYVMEKKEVYNSFVEQIEYLLGKSALPLLKEPKNSTLLKKQKALIGIARFFSSKESRLNDKHNNIKILRERKCQPLSEQEGVKGIEIKEEGAVIIGEYGGQFLEENNEEEILKITMKKFDIYKNLLGLSAPFHPQLAPEKQKKSSVFKDELSALQKKVLGKPFKKFINYEVQEPILSTNFYESSAEKESRNAYEKKAKQSFTSAATILKRDLESIFLDTTNLLESNLLFTEYFHSQAIKWRNRIPKEHQGFIDAGLNLGTYLDIPELSEEEKAL